MVSDEGKFNPNTATETTTQSASESNVVLYGKGSGMGWLEECDKAAKALTPEQRQKFLDELWTGKTLGEARELAGISFDAANGVVRQNIERHEYNTLRRVAV